MTESWIRHFSQANPRDANPTSVPMLLRRAADSIETLGEVEIQDITFETEMTQDGPCHDLTVYFTRPDDAEEQTD